VGGGELLVDAVEQERPQRHVGGQIGHCQPAGEQHQQRRQQPPPQ
jgi:hypothetical protein